MIKDISSLHGINIGMIMHEITAVVPTRKGSERVKSKNTRPFAGKSLLEVKLETLLYLKDNTTRFIKDIVVNSDCEESRRIAESYGVPFIERDPYLASSDAPIVDYWKEVLLNTKTEHSMLCQCTSPLISYPTYTRAICAYNGKSLICVDDVKDYLWYDHITHDEPHNYDWPNHPKSQDLDGHFYKLNFGIAIISKEELKEFNNIKTPNSIHYHLSEHENLDIDNTTEFKIAEMMYKEKTDMEMKYQERMIALKENNDGNTE